MGKIVKNGVDYSRGATGPQGPQGNPGVNGIGVPAGGLTGQILQKVSGDDYDTEWVTPSGGGGGLNFDGAMHFKGNKPVSYGATDSQRYVRLNLADGTTSYDGKTVDFVNNDYLCILSASGRFEVLSNDDSYQGKILCSFIKRKNNYNLIPLSGIIKEDSSINEPLSTSSWAPEIIGYDSNGVEKRVIVSGPSTRGVYLSGSSNRLTIYIPWSYAPSVEGTIYTYGYDLALIPMG